MRIDILTLFPENFTSFINTSIIGRAIKNNLVNINIIDIRDFSTATNRQVDDYPFGGGAGMVMMCEPVFRAVESVKTNDSKVILLTPAGKRYHQKQALALSKEKHLILICGHYEGIDERILTLVDYEISIGDYVLTGGELASLVLTDSIVRLLPNVINEESLLSESFNNNLLDYPNYTKPRIFRDMEVPEVLLSGNHAKIDAYRKAEQLRKTKNNRPDLLEGE